MWELSINTFYVPKCLESQAQAQDRVAAYTSSSTIVCCRYRVHGEVLDIYTTYIVMFNVAQVFQV